MTRIPIAGIRMELYSMNMSAEKTFYLETFGCQMNVHDSEKVVGTLVPRAIDR